MSAVQAAKTRHLARLSLSAKVGIAGLSLLVLVAIVAPAVFGDEADRVTQAVRAPASADHPLGTDSLGRDMLARTLVATRLTLVMAAGATAIALIAGALLGAALALSGRRTTAAGDRLIQLLIAFPPILVAIAIVAVFQPGAVSAAVAIGVAFTPAFARMTNTLARSVASREHVVVARLMGRSSFWLLRRHVFPNVADTLLVLTSVAFASSVIALSALGFLGLGVQPPSYDWGGLLSAGLEALYTNPVQAVGPATAILLTGLFAGLIGDGVAVALAPQQVFEPSGTRAAQAGPPRRAQTPSHGSANGAVDADGLVVRDLCVTDARDDQLVRDVALEVGKSEIVGLVGESGSGKTLTAMSIARLLPSGLRMSATQLQLRDLDLLGQPPQRRLAQDVAVIFQDPSTSLNPVLRIGSQMTEVERVHAGVAARDARQAAAAALRSVRIDEAERVLRSYPHELSGGMRQRVMLATALMRRPALLIADEPTTALDVTVQADVLELLREANESSSTTILFISHDIAVVAQLCHRVLVMYGGQIVEELSAERLKAGRVNHPYTRALLDATPRLDAALEGERDQLAALPGRPPLPSSRPPGCQFEPRCAYATDRCRAESPGLRALESRHQARCHLAEQVGRS